MGRGVIITAGGRILYAEDLNGDGGADLIEDWFTGFVEDNQQLRVNSLRWGLDGWIYCASGGHHAGFGLNTVINSVKSGKNLSLDLVTLGFGLTVLLNLSQGLHNLGA